MIGSSARTSTIAASLARNGPGGRSPTKRGAGIDAEVGGDGAGARHDQLQTVAFAHLQPQTGVADPAVERVEQRADRGVRLLELEAQIGERSDGNGRIVLAGGERRWKR